LVNHTLFVLIILIDCELPALTISYYLPEVSNMIKLFNL